MRTSKHYPWVVVGLLWFVALLNYMDRQMLSTMKEAMQIDIAELQSAETFGILMAAFMWVYALASPVAGLVADRINRKWLIVGSLFIWSLVTLLMGYTTDFSVLYALRMVMGLSEALYMPTALALIADFHQGKARSLAVGIHMTGLYVGQALGGYGARLADPDMLGSWSKAFFYFGLVGAVYAVVLAFALFEAPQRQEAKLSASKASASEPTTNLGASLKKIFTTPAFWIILLFFTATSFPGWATKNWLPTLFSTNLGIGMQEAGPMATITITLSSFIGVFLGGWLSDTWVKRNLKGRVFTSALGISLMIPALLLLGFGTTKLMLIAGGACFGIGYGLFDANTMPILCQFVSAKYRSTAYGLINMTGVFAGAVITQLLGKIGEDTLGQSFALLAIGVAVVVLVQLVFLRPKTDDMI